MNVENRMDESLGQVEQLLINRNTGPAAYVVVDAAGLLGMQEREVAVPWKALNFTGPEEIVLTRAENLEQAPEFDEDAFLGMENLAEWEREVEDFFGVGETTEDR